jgi:hypothetical protein
LLAIHSTTFSSTLCNNRNCEALCSYRSQFATYKPLILERIYRVLEVVHM